MSFRPHPSLEYGGGAISVSRFQPISLTSVFRGSAQLFDDAVSAASGGLTLLIAAMRRVEAEASIKGCQASHYAFPIMTFYRLMN